VDRGRLFVKALNLSFSEGAFQCRAIIRLADPSYTGDLGYALRGLSSGIIADAFGLASAIFTTAAVTLLSGIAVAVLMRSNPDSG
jgi:hypothetical protein